MEIDNDYSVNIKKLNSGLLSFKSITDKVNSILPKVRASSSLKSHSRIEIASSIEPIGIRRLGYKKPRKIIFNSYDSGSTRSNTVLSKLKDRLREMKFNQR